MGAGFFIALMVAMQSDFAYDASMKSVDSFKEYVVHDCMSGIDGITSRAMFGGYALYCSGVVFAIILSDRLYFKTSDVDRLLYEQYGSEAFSYARGGKVMHLKSYYEVPEVILEDRKELAEWVARAIHAAQQKHVSMRKHNTSKK
jgi:DNA transformation protein